MASTRTIVPLVASDRHAHTPATRVERGPFYEWWYFEVEFDLKTRQGTEHWRVITSLHFPHGLDPLRNLTAMDYDPAGPPYRQRFPCDADRYPGVASYVVRQRPGQHPRNIALLITRLKDQSVVSLSTSGPVKLQFDDVASFQETPGGKYVLRVHQDGCTEGGLELRLDFECEFTQNTTGFRTPGAVLINDGQKDHHWACVMPNPKVRVQQALLTKGARGFLKGSDLGKISPTGGYHDHQWGGAFIYERLQEWSWGRLVIPPASGTGHGDRLVFFDIKAKPPGVPTIHPDPVLVLARGRGGPSRRLTPIGMANPFKPIGRAEVKIKPLRSRGVRYHKKLRIWCKDGSKKFKYTIEHKDSKLVDVWPFYLRYLADAAPAGSGAPVEAISEYMVANRLTLPKVQRALAWSRILTVVKQGGVRFRTTRSHDACE